MTGLGFTAAVAASRRRRGAPALASDQPGDEGYTLLEVLIALTIMGLAFTAILAGIATAIFVTYDNRQRAEADRYGRLMAEKLKSAEAPYQYIPCGTAAAYRSALTPADIAGLNLEGWRVEIDRVDYLVSATANTNAAYDANCNTTSDPDLGMQRITVTAKPPVGTFRADKTTQRINVYKRNTSTDCNLSVQPLGGSC